MDIDLSAGIDRVYFRADCRRNIFKSGRDANYNNYIIMRLARTSLHDLIQSYEYLSKPWSAKAKIALDIAQGLQHLHEKQIVHCDIHSGNVLVEQVCAFLFQTIHHQNPKYSSGHPSKPPPSQDGRALLTDFGLSRTFAEAQQPEFRIKIYGRLGYLAPELLRRPPPAYCPAHDIFGLGVLLWEIASSDSPNTVPEHLSAVWSGCGGRETRTGRGVGSAEEGVGGGGGKRARGRNGGMGEELLRELREEDERAARKREGEFGQFDEFVNVVIGVEERRDAA
ncbi:kinase-like domain-containing protein [Endogone sp. FLAS-F59071]|nr:kinase-like domain-containing protein [Endogone sp. FLAS-F59071]|eukprot:RUS17046.1 kinase-like domain-containing protein [Endogone sp. FLAS-F59071]